MSVNGLNFGIRAYSQVAGIGSNGFSSCISTAWSSDTLISCRTMAGTGKALRLAVSTYNLAGSVSGIVSYNTPNVLFAARANIPTSGSSVVQVAGGDFGIFGRTARLAVGHSAGMQSIWTSDSSLCGKSTRGATTSLQIKSTISLQLGSASFVASYDTPLLSAASLNAVPMTGSIFANISGRNLGYLSQSSSIRIGVSVAPFSLWISESSIRCRSSAGSGTSSAILVTSGRTTSVVFSGAMSFVNPSLSSSLITNSPVSGFILVSVLGRHTSTFDTTSAAKVGFSAVMFSFWTSSSSVTLKLASGLFFSGAIAISTNLRSGSSSVLLFYDAATVSKSSITNLAPSGSVVLSLSGSNFASNSRSMRARIHGSGQEFTVWTSDSSFACRSTSGSSASRAVIASASGSGGSISRAVSYNAPAALANLSASADSGSMVVVVHAVQLGTVSQSQRIALGVSACEYSSWFSESMIVCKSSAGTSFSLLARVSSSNLRGSVSAVFSYVQSAVSSAIGTNSPRSGSSLLTVTGSSFGAASYSQMIAFGSTSVAASMWISVSAILGKVAMGSGTRLPLTVSLSIRQSILTAVVSYDFVVPVIADRFLPSTGQAFVVALGVGNGLMSLSHIIKFGKSTSESSVWTSESSVVSLNSRGSARQLLLVVSAFGVGSVSLAIAYVAPNVSSAVFNAPASGSVSMSIFGTSFSVGNSGAARLGGSAVVCVSRSWSGIFQRLCCRARGDVFDFSHQCTVNW